MKNKIFYGAGIVLVGLLLVLLGVDFGNFNLVGASAPSGLPATLYKVTNIEVGPQENTLVFTSTDRCSSRIISTVGTSIMINFATTSAQATSTAYLSEFVGHVQGASTTIAYDSGIYGCPAVGIFGVASTTIRITEFR